MGSHLPKQSWQKACWHSDLPVFLINDCCDVVRVCITLYVEHRTQPGIVNCLFFCVPGLIGCCVQWDHGWRNLRCLSNGCCLIVCKINWSERAGLLVVHASHGWIHHIHRICIVQERLIWALYPWPWNGFLFIKSCYCSLLLSSSMKHVVVPALMACRVLCEEWWGLMNRFLTLNL